MIYDLLTIALGGEGVVGGWVRFVARLKRRAGVRLAVRGVRGLRAWDFAGGWRSPREELSGRKSSC